MLRERSTFDGRPFADAAKRVLPCVSGFSCLRSASDAKPQKVPADVPIAFHMKFELIDKVITQEEGRIVAIKQVTAAEEYLADHFPTFPVLPGVMMVEAMVQAARIMLAPRGDGRLALGAVRNMKFGNMVRPGEAMEVEVTLAEAADDGSFACKGACRVIRHDINESERETAVSGRFTMRPIRAEPACA